ncbi:MAG TPA: phosphate acyltransferase PlsX [bacterium]|nr:phosphate acyltransferase PlsX [bacterium]
MKIVLDAMGGDKAPDCEVEGAVLALREFKDVSVVLVGKKEEISEKLNFLNTAQKIRDRIEIVNADEVIGMSEKPAEAYKKKPGASIVVAAGLLKEEKGDALVSAGNTGAVVVASLLKIGRLNGVKRPAILTPMPSKTGITGILDAGANVDCKPVHLAQFALMGNAYAQNILNIEKPRVGLLSVGEEEEKGNELTYETRRLINKLNLNFIGNVEGRDATNGRVDIIVCDGFVGNVILKTAEGVGRLLGDIIKEQIAKGSIFRKIGALMVRGAFKHMKKRIDPNIYGGAPLVGIKKPVIITHGSIDSEGIKNAIRVASEFIKRHINEEIEQAISGMEENGG